MSDAALTTFTIYQKPLEFPDAWVVRRWRIKGSEPSDGGLWCLSKPLEGARESIPEGLYCMPREPADDPRIVETWL